ncbi:hypothetical protein [Anoxybacter fermentans]|uniref:hypothetical protein n=1 Tax=Anoxybacter fermentans TaxID=1323375 RepID=UPI000F8CCF83|nr:hypothetical protein [Anoxybacter fermentans]
MACIYTTLVTIAAYNKKDRFSIVLKSTMYVDILLINLVLCARGGLRSDSYFLYFIVISYNGIKYGFRGTIYTLIFSTITSFYFTPPEQIQLNLESFI